MITGKPTKSEIDQEEMEIKSAYTIEIKSASTVENSKSKSSLKEAAGGIVKEGKGRLYIFGRCVAMLLCWHDHTN